MKRMPELSNYKIEENGHLKNSLAGNKKMKELVGKDLIVHNEHNVALYFMQDEELSELEDLKEGLLLTVIKDNKIK